MATILIVDDDAIDRELASRSLARVEGLEILTATHGADALEHRQGLQVELGLVDEVVPPAILLEAACELAVAVADKPTVERSAVESITSTFKHLLSTEEVGELLLEDNPLGRRVLFEQAKKRLLAKTKGNYPAPEAALRAVWPHVGADAAMADDARVNAERPLISAVREGKQGASEQ